MVSSDLLCQTRGDSKHYRPEGRIEQLDPMGPEVENQLLVFGKELVREGHGYKLLPSKMLAPWE
jgi:hypothetical protein